MAHLNIYIDIMQIGKTKWYVEYLRPINHDLNGVNIEFNIFPTIHIEYHQHVAIGIIVGWLCFHIFINNIPHENEDSKIPWE